METRRQFLKKAAIFSGAAGYSNVLVNSIRSAAAIEPEPGSSFLDAEHVVILMQENRSFDHAFGTLQGVRGFNDPRAISLPNGNPVWVQSTRKGESYVPFRLNIKDSNATWLGSLPHSWSDQVDARNGGRHDRWLSAKRSGHAEYAHIPLTLGYYTREDLPFYYQLADAFTICDQNFCSSLTGTTPNRLHLWTGTIRPEQHAASPARVLNSDTGFDSPASWSTFPERLEDLEISWKIYQNELSIDVGFHGEEGPWLANFDDNPLEYFSQFNVRFSAARRKFIESRIQSLQAEIADLLSKSASKDAAEAAYDAEQVAKREGLLKRCQDERRLYTVERFETLAHRARNLHEKAFCTNHRDPDFHRLTELNYRDGTATRRMQIPEGDVLHQFRRDVADGKLPTVSWVVPPERFSDHPSSAWYGAWYIAEMLDILSRNPAVWKKTIFILTYDENDGYFDHVPPFGAPDPRRPETGLVSRGIDAGLEYVTLEQELKRKPPADARENSIGLGYRVPLIVASPWSRGGWVCSQVFDHTSPLQFLEKLLSHKTGKEVKETNVNQWRRTVCGDLTSVFQGDVDENSSTLKFPERNEFLEQIHSAQFKKLPSGYKLVSDREISDIRQNPRTSQLLPSQESGVRRSCALPYELFVDAALNDDRRRLSINFHAGNRLFGAAGSPFIAYALHGDDNISIRNYAVLPGDRIVDTWSIEKFVARKYRFLVYGPNGFFREFRGAPTDPLLDLRAAYSRGTDADISLDGNIELSCVNRDSRRHRIKIAGLSYSQIEHVLDIAPGEREVCTIATAGSFGWYDFSVSIVNCESFGWSYAGRVETGKSTFSDPAIGRTEL